MSGSQMLLLGGNPQQAAVDPYFYSVTSLLHGDGTNGGQNNTFLDSSTNNFTITRNGNTTQGSFSPFSQTGWSNFFDGTGDYLTATCNAISGAYTFEAWIYATTATVGNIYSTSGSGGLSIYRSSTGRLGVQTGSSAYIETIEGVLIANTWCHVAVTKNASNTYVMYVNGVSYPAVSTLGTMGSSYSAGTGQVGTAFNISANFTGYISNLRVVNGTQVYTSNFTPPTAPLTAISNTEFLTCQSNRFIDNSSNAFAITRNGDVSVQPFSPFNPITPYSTSSIGGSGYFDGSGDFLTVSNNTALDMGTGDFTVEMWVFSTLASTDTQFRRFLATGQNSTSAIQIGHLGTTTGVVSYSSDADIAGTTITGTTNILNQWAHVAVVRSSGTVKLYVNGVSEGTPITDSNSKTTSAFTLGKYPGLSGHLNGYLSNVRIVKGTAVYTANFTPPTTPLTAIANTSLLTNFTNGAIFDNAAVADYETVGNAQISTSVKKYGTGSMAFDGTGDYLLPASNQNFAFRTGDFTVEYWIYTNSSADDGIFQLSTTAGGFATSYTNGMMMAVVSGVLYYALGGSSVSTGLTINNSTWYHVAMCRTSGVLKVYVNGTPVISTANTTDVTATNLVIGGYYSSSYTLVGYIDDFRISRVSRYPYGFTPPTAEFPNIGGTVTLTADPYFDYTTLLLPGNGTNGAQNNTFLDSSTNNFTITRNGNTTQGTFSPFSQTGWSAYFDGSGDFLNFTKQTTTGAFTCECWFYRGEDQANYHIVFGGSNASVGPDNNQMIVQNDGAVRLTLNATGIISASGTGSVTKNQWNHIAWVRSGTSCAIFVNGSRVGTGTSSVAVNIDRIGSLGGVGAGYDAIGYISNARITTTAVYDPSLTTCTVPTAPLTAVTGTYLLTLQSNRFVDNSASPLTITVNGNTSVQSFSPFNPTAAWSASTNGGSGYFDGSGDYLTVADNAALQMGSGDFTIEYWWYPNNITSYQNPIEKGYTGTGGLLLQTGNGDGRIIVYASGSAVVTSSTAVTANAWNHMALVRSGTTLTLYQNGVSVGSATNSTNFNNTTQLGIGATGAPVIGSFPIVGFLSGVRFVKGTAVYSGSTYTVPTAPLTAITNTSLLLNYTNAGIYDATSKNDLETVGNAQISTTQSKFGGSSMLFDGTGDYLLSVPRQPLALGSGDWTVEAWVYLTAAPVEFTALFCSWNYYTSGYNGNFIGRVSTSNLWTSFNGQGDQIAINGTYSWTQNTWFHMAWVRFGSTITVYRDGVSIGSTTDSKNLSDSENGLLIGVNRTNGTIGGGSPTQYITGYVDDFRVTRGIARYTSNFTPPTTAFLTL